MGVYIIMPPCSTGGKGASPVKHNGYVNYIPDDGGSQEGSRQAALLPQKTRKIYSYVQLKEALSGGLRNPAAVPISRFEFFVEEDGEKRPVGAFAGSDPQTIAFYLELARKNNWAVLYQGTILITKKIAGKLRKNRRIAKGDWEKIVQLDLKALFGPDIEVVRLAYRVLIDIDNKDKDALWRLVKYLWKLKVYPEVWETKDGYHLYFYFYYEKVYQEIKVEDEDGKERVEKVLVGYTLPYADDYRIKDVEECLKVLCAKLNIKPDIVSATHAVWLEGFPNPLKDGFATKRLLTGFPLPLQDLWQKLLNVNPAKVRQKVRQNKPRYYRKRKPKAKDTDKEEEGLRELDDFLLGEHSNVFFALSQHGTLKACKKLLDAGYSLRDIESELRDRLDIRTTSDKKDLQNFLAHFEENYTKSTNRQKSPPKEEEHKEEERKHEHYWELAVRVIEAWEKGYQKISHMAKYLGVPRSNIYNLRSFLRKHGYEWEDLFTKSEEVLAFLKAHAKGGNKWHRKKEWDREAWLKEVQSLTAEYIKQRKREAEIRRAKKRAEFKEQGIDPDRWTRAPVWFLPVGSVYIGNIPVYFCEGINGSLDGSPLTNRPPQPKNRTRSTGPFKTPAAPLVLPKGLTSSLQDALFNILQKHHCEDGLPVVLVVPKRVSTVKGTILQLTPYKVPPRSFKQLWKEIKEKFGKLVQGLSTKNGALDWFRRVWEKFKEEIMSNGWVSVGSSPFSFKENSAFRRLSKQLSEGLPTPQAEPSSEPKKRTESLQSPAHQVEPYRKLNERPSNKLNPTFVLSGQEFATLESLFKAHPDKKISELMPYMSEKSRQLFEQVQLVLKQEFASLHKLKEKGELNSASLLVEKTESIIRLLEYRFCGLLSMSSFIFHRLLETVLRNIEKICEDVMLFSGWESLTATDLLRKLSSADTYEEFLQAAAELRNELSTEQQTFLEFLTDIELIRKKMHAQQQEKLSAKKKANKKSGFPSSQVVQTALKFLEERTQGSDVVKVSREELETAIHTAWKNADPEKANRKAVSEYIDKFEGVLWKKLNNGHYGMLVSSDEARARIRDYVLGLKQAKKNGQGQTSADGNGSVGSELLTRNENSGNGKPSANGNGSLGSQSSNGNNGNGKYDIDQIIHTLQKEGKVYVPPQFVHEIVRELGRRGLSVSYWTTTGLIELVGGDDELPF